MKLAHLVDMLRGEAPVESPTPIEMSMADAAPPLLLERLAKLARLGLLNGDVIMALVAQAPIDPLGLAGHLVKQNPAGWAFSSIDCSIVRVLVRTADKAVAAAVRVDLLDDGVETLVLNKAGQLTSYRKYETMEQVSKRAPGEWLLEEVQKLCDEATLAAAREAAPS